MASQNPLPDKVDQPQEDAEPTACSKVVADGGIAFSLGKWQCQNGEHTTDAQVYCNACELVLCTDCNTDLHTQTIPLQTHEAKWVGIAPDSHLPAGALCATRDSGHRRAAYFYCIQDDMLLCQECVEPHEAHPTKHVYQS